MKLSDLHEPFGWTLLHFLWQGAAIAAVYSLLLLCVRRSARGRYLSGITALATMGIVFSITFARQLNVAAESRAAAAREAAAVSRVPPPPVLIDTPVDDSATNVRGASASGAVPLPLPPTPGPDREVSLRPNSQGISPDAASTEVERPASIAAAADAPAWSGPLQSALPWIVGAWGLGVILLLLRFVLGWRSVRRMKASGETPHDSQLLLRFAALCERLRISRPVGLLVSPTVGVPALVGWLKPVVIIPAALLAGLTQAQTEAILAHELGHVRRHDFLVNALQCLLEIVLFYHPAVWWISSQVRREREHCCDDIAATCCGGAADYARALAALEEWRGTAVPALSMAASGGSLVGRIRRLVGHRDSAAELPVWPLSLVAGALMFAVLPLAWRSAAFAQSPAVDAVSPQTHPSASSPLSELDNDTRLKLAIAAADGFFKAGDAASKMKFLRLEDPSARASAEAHFEKHGAAAIPEAHVILSRVQDDGSVVLAYAIGSRSHFFRATIAPASTPGSAEAKPASDPTGITAEEAGFDHLLGTFKIEGNIFGAGTGQGGAMLLDWENSTWCQQGVYHVAKTELPKEPFRVLAVSRRDGYYNHGFADNKRWDCHALRFPGVKGLLYGYLDRTSPHFPMLQERHQQGLSTTLSFTVRFPADGKGNQVEILKVEPVTGSVNQIGGKAAPAYHGQKEIMHAGTHVISPRITVKVSQDAEEDTLHNTLEIEGTDDAGNKITDSCALPYGVQTWALLIEEPALPDGSCIVSIGSRWGVRRFAFESDRKSARFSKPGFDDECRWFASEKMFFSETLPQFANAAVVDWWETRLRHILKIETPRDTPALEVRLICEDVDIAASKGPEIPEMIRPDSRLGASRLPRFINLGPLLLAAEDLASGGSYIIGSTKHLTRIRDRSLPRFRKLCQHYYGRQAAVVNNGAVLGSFKLENGVNSFSTYTSLTGLSASEGSGAIQFKPAPAGSTAHAITVQSPDGKGIPAFRVIAGVRSSVSADFEKKHNCTVVNWQSHMLREGKDGKLEWSLSERSYSEMVLRVEADGFVPQMTGWLKKADGAQEITVTLAPDPGIRGSVQTPGNKRWAHDATVVLGMIRKEIRIKGATFPELDLGPEP